MVRIAAAARSCAQVHQIKNEFLVVKNSNTDWRVCLKVRIEWCVGRVEGVLEGEGWRAGVLGGLKAVLAGLERVQAWLKAVLAGLEAVLAGLEGVFGNVGMFV